MDALGDFDVMSSIGYYGSQNGYTIVNFILLYIIGAYIGKCEIRFGKKIYACLIMIPFIIFGMLIFRFEHGAIIILLLLYLLPVCSFFFKIMHFENKTVNKLSKASFTCYLVNGYFLKYISVEKYVNGNVLITEFINASFQS